MVRSPAPEGLAALFVPGAEPRTRQPICRRGRQRSDEHVLLENWARCKQPGVGEGQVLADCGDDDRHLGPLRSSVEVSLVQHEEKPLARIRPEVDSAVRKIPRSMGRSNMYHIE